MNKHKRRLLIFLKAPTTGNIKTRLAESIGAHKAMRIYIAMVKDLIDNLAAYKHLITYYIDSMQNRALLFTDNSGHMDIRLQRGRTLGEKMKNAFLDIFSGDVNRALLVGSDIPTLTPLLINVYFRQLESSDMTIGPSADGGYYLIGFNRQKFTAGLFEDITWSRKTVYKKTVQKANFAHLSLYTGKLLNDIDTIKDLKELFTDHNTGYSLPRLKKVYTSLTG